MSIYTPKYQPTGNEIAIFKTSKGEIKVQLAGKDAPIHVGNFVELVKSGFYNGLKFHRLEPGFVIQGGCPYSAEFSSDDIKNHKLGTEKCGTGGPGYTIKEEFSVNPNNSHEDGTLAMARSQSPNSAGSQFYFCLGDQHFLDSNYTVFGKTIEGKDVISTLELGDEIFSIDIQ